MKRQVLRFRAGIVIDANSSWQWNRVSILSEINKGSQMRVSPTFAILLSLIFSFRLTAVLAQHPATIPFITSPTFGPARRSGAVSRTIVAPPPT